MPNFAANLSMQFNEHGFLDRFKAASRCGFKGVEYLFPYDFDKEDIADRLQSNGLQQVLFNLPAGNWSAGERGLTCLPDRAGEFQDSIGIALEYAAALDCSMLHTMAGICPEGADAELVRQVYVDNVRYAAAELAKEEKTLVLEPINFKDMPGFYINYSWQAIEVIKEIDASNLKLQFDIYHAQRMEGDLLNTIRDNVGVIAHMQLADNPGRHEPGSGEIDYPFLFDAIDAAGYTGWIGCEYIPAAGTEEGLGWLAPHI